MVFVVLFVIVLNPVGEYSSQDAGNALCKMAAPQTACLRDGREVLIEAAALVVGDWACKPPKKDKSDSWNPGNIKDITSNMISFFLP